MLPTIFNRRNSSFSKHTAMRITTVLWKGFNAHAAVKGKRKDFMIVLAINLLLLCMLDVRSEKLRNFETSAHVPLWRA